MIKPISGEIVTPSAPARIYATAPGSVLILDHAAGKCFGQHSSRERQRDGSKQNLEIGPEQRGVGGFEPVEDPVKVNPHDADVDESREEGRIRRPVMQQFGAQRVLLIPANSQIQHQQCHGDGKHAIAEELGAMQSEPPRRVRRLWCVPDSPGRFVSGQRSVSE